MLDEHTNDKSLTVANSVPYTQVSIPIPSIRTVTNSITNANGDVKESIPAHSTQRITGGTSLITSSIPYTEVSIPVPSISTATNSIPSIDSDVHESISALSTRIHDDQTMTSSTPYTQVSIPVPIINIHTDTAPGSRTSIPTFRTNIRGNYMNRHPLISKTAYESEV